MGKIDKKLMAQASAKFMMALVMIGVLLFVPAGTIHYWNAWVLISALFVPIFIAGAVMLACSPDLLRKRLNNKEKESEQRVVIALSGLMFLASFILAGLDFRFGWTRLPSSVVWISAVVLVLSYLLYAEVMRENAYLSRTIEVQEGQKVVDTGLYGIVRHPMYLATILLFLSMPLVLGSVWSFVVMLRYLPIINARIKNEEEVLTRDLDGYKEYKQKVAYKVIPFIW